MDDHKRSIRIAAQFKANTYFWFIEPDHFVYDFDPEISTEYDRFKFDEIRELAAYAREYYIEVIPVVELLAHMEMTLRHDRYRHLSEDGRGGGFRHAAGINLSELNHFGFTCCSAVSRNPDPLPLEQYSEAFALNFFANDDARLSEALTRLARCQGGDLRATCRARRLFHSDPVESVFSMMGADDDTLAFWRTLKKDTAATHAALADAQPQRNADYLRSIDLAARLFECSADMALAYFDHAGDGVWADSLGSGTVLAAANGAPAILEGGPSGTGNCLHLDHGVHIEAVDAGRVLDIKAAPLLVEAWVRHRGQREQQYGATIFSYGLGGGFRLGINHNGEVLFTLYGIGETAGSRSIVPPDGEWHHLAVNFHRCRCVDTYVDGALTGQLELKGYPRTRRFGVLQNP